MLLCFHSELNIYKINAWGGTFLFKFKIQHIIYMVCCVEKYLSIFILAQVKPNQLMIIMHMHVVIRFKNTSDINSVLKMQLEEKSWDTTWCPA